ncbi:unnamed protein product [Oikopleura dioica]|uniref:short-chain acyl-CoA dehydrogenase n=1 Tax=Oikopleura dioica TaxID=34765 RepID=E4X1H8_OIKDI|nr:unnamed protein product [Oikopleura dioica]
MLRNLTRSSRKLSASAQLGARLHNWQSEKLTDIGTGVNYDSDMDIFREQCRKFWAGISAERVEKWDKNHMPDAEIWREAGEAGLLCIDTPAEYGGIGAPFEYSMVACEEQAYAGPKFYGPGFGLHSGIVAPYITSFGTEEQKHKYIPSMTTGETISCIGMTEPSGGSDLQAMKTNAVRDGDDWILNGSKTFISNGTLANLGLIAARTKKEGRAAHAISLFLVDTREHNGFNKGKNLRKIGQHSYDTAELFFDDVRLPASALLGEEEGLNKGFYMMMNELPRERVGCALEALARLENAFEQTRQYTQERKAFGGPLSDKQVIKHSMAEIKTEIVSVRLMADECVRLYSRGELDNETASMFKLYATEKYVSCVNKLLQHWGGWGYMWEYDIAKEYAGARVFTIYAGTSEIMKELISRDVYPRK